jgi:hypothetical protein
VQVHLVDGTYELFRHYFARPSERDVDGREVAAVRGVVASMFGMVTDGATHSGIATDHVIESFRNGLWRGYKTSAGVPRTLSRSSRSWKSTLVAAASWCGRWSSSRQMMRLASGARLRPRTRASSA